MTDPLSNIPQQGVRSDCAESYSSDGWESDTWSDYVNTPEQWDLVDDVPADTEKYLRERFHTQKYPKLEN